MTYKIIWDDQSKVFLKKLAMGDAQRIIKKVNSIIDNPMRYLDTLVDINGYKLRVGDYRVLIEINKQSKSINVLFIGHRRNIYKYLKSKGNI